MPVIDFKKIECDFCGYTDSFEIKRGQPPEKVAAMLSKWHGHIAGDSQLGQGGLSDALTWYDSIECLVAGIKRDGDRRELERMALQAAQLHGAQAISGKIIPTSEGN